MSEPPAVSKMNEADASLSERFVTATALVDSSPEDAVSHLQELQKQVAALALFSTNEGIEDMSTKSLPLLALEFHLAMAHLACRAQTSRERKTLVGTSIDLFSSFLQRLEELELLSKEHTKDYHDLLDIMTDNEDDQRSSVSRRTQGQQREAKIARFRAKQQAQKEAERLKSLQQRRGRLETLSEEEMDGFDEESLERQVAIQNLNVHAAEALDEWFQAQRELPMIEMAIQMEERKSAQELHRGVTPDSKNGDKRQPPLSGKPLQVTHITQDALTGHLKMQKEEIRSKVFQPGWNQPTMTLEELGELERKQAIEREARQKSTEAEQKNAPRRYDQLVKDGLEDNADLVDAGAQLDRDWDDFKDANPRGWGNKMGDRGDRNF